MTLLKIQCGRSTRALNPEFGALRALCNHIMHSVIKCSGPYVISALSTLERGVFQILDVMRTRVYMLCFSLVPRPKNTAWYTLFAHAHNFP